MAPDSTCFSMKCIVFILSLIVSFSSLAQTGLPPVYELMTDTTEYAIDSTHFQLLDDSTGDLTINQVSQSPQSGRFYYDKPLNPNRQSGVYWLRMRVRNNLSKPVKLFCTDFYSDYFDLYTPANGRWLHQQAGSSRPRSQITVHNGIRERNRLFISLQPGETKTLYQRSEVVFWRARRTYIEPGLQTEAGRVETAFRSFLTGGWQDYYIDGMLLGVLLLAAICNLLIFIGIRDRTYLYFGICILFIALDRNAYRMQLAFFPEYPIAIKAVGNFFFILYFLFFTQSIRVFLRPVAAQKTLNRSITYTLLLTTVLTVIQLFAYGVPHFPTYGLAISLEVMIRIVYLLVIIMNVQIIQRGSRQARSSLIAILPLFGLWSVTLASQLSSFLLGSDVLRLSLNFPEYLESACFAWMIIFFSGALVGRFNQVSQQVSQQALEKEQLEREREIERSNMIASENERLERQVQERTTELQTSLDHLKATQAQLIQSEKMASLGELTAGIAHEIQNPLNFVNNFAEVSAELVGELEDEQQSPARDPELETELLGDLKQNLEKISLHGKRASGIVRGMLEHARTTTGQKEPTDLNALCDEYLRLAYHGLRAKDKTFNCALVTDFDPNAKPVPVVAQDIGRVVLNLLNNAFYAVRERQGDAPTTYQPAVTVTTRQLDHRAEIRIQDNGTGMPEGVQQKIFQPFFTTKPSGSGTGLGLSLSFDIITKGHGGTLTVVSHEGEGTTFIILLPAA